MPRQDKNPERVLRAARAYIAGEIEFPDAVVRSAASRHAVWNAVKKLRAQAVKAQP